jgi:hypothetical protein
MRVPLAIFHQKFPPFVVYGSEHSPMNAKTQPLAWFDIAFERILLSETIQILIHDRQ